jgi:hypothetical protein
MSRGWSWKSGEWWVLCDVCNRKTIASEIKKRWDGFLVCADDYETRQPLDFIRARVDKISVPFSRPRGTDTFVNVCSIPTGTAYADAASADCSKADNTYGFTYAQILADFS